MPNRPAPTSIALLGLPGSGKTTFLARLRDSVLERGGAVEGGEHLDTASPNQGASRRVTYSFAEDDVSYAFALTDRPGAATEKVNAGIDGARGALGAEAKALKAELRAAAGAIFVADLRDVVADGGWEAYLAARRIRVFDYVRDVLSDATEVPVLVVLAHDDEVPARDAAETLGKVRAWLRGRLPAADAHAFRGTPGGQASSGSPTPDRMMLDLIRRLRVAHRPLVIPAMMALIAGTVILLGAAYRSLRANPDAPTTQGDVTRTFERARTLADAVGTVERQLASVSDADRDGLARTAVALAHERCVEAAGRISYKARAGEWYPPDAAATIVDGTSFLKRRGAVGELRQIQNTLKAVLDLVEWDDLSRAQLQNLAREYDKIDEPVPSDVRGKLTRLAIREVREQLALAFNTADVTDPVALRELYEQKIPAIVADARTGGTLYLTDDARAQLDDVTAYTDRLRKLTRVSLVFESFERATVGAEPELSLVPLFRLTVASKPAPQHYYILEGKTATVIEDESEWPKGKPVPTETYQTEALGRATLYVQRFAFPKTGNAVAFDWRPGLPIEIFAKAEHQYTMWPDEIVDLARWSSQKPSPRRVAEGLDLPGLTFLVFLDAHADWTPGTGEKARAFRCRLRLAGTSNVYDLLSVPELLTRSRREGKPSLE
jgi:hypothetical protein